MPQHSHKSCPSSVLRRFILGTAFLACLGGSASAKTLMWLGNWYQSTTFRIGLISSDSVWVPGYSTLNPSGYYTAGGGQNLYLTKVPLRGAFVDTTQTMNSITSWWSVPSWDRSQYREGRFRLMMKYTYKDGPGMPPSVERMDISEMNGLNAQNASLIDNCLDTLVGDTLWMYLGLGQFSSRQGVPLCSDHNPYLENKGRIDLFAPSSGNRLSVIWQGHEQRMKPLAKIGWMEANLWSLPGGSETPSVVFKVEHPDGTVSRIDSAGGPYHLAPFPTLNTIYPSMGGTPGYRDTVVSGSPKLVLAWKNPWSTRTAEVVLDDSSRFRGSWNPSVGYTLPLWVRPDSVWLSSPSGDSTTRPVIVPSTLQLGDTVWVTTKPVKPSSILLTGTAYDFLVPGPYFPFSESTNGPVRGMVAPKLAPDGNVQWSGGNLCGGSFTINAKCTDSLNGPNHWFQPLFQGSVALNASTWTSVNLQWNPYKNTYQYANDAYFPLDTFSTLAGGTTNSFNEKGVIGHNFGFCEHFSATAEIVQSGLLSINAGGDAWVFLDSQLVIDLGGQHGPEAGEFRFDPFVDSPNSAVALDIFYCARHQPGSNLSLSVNFPLYPVGQIQNPVFKHPTTSRRTIQISSMDFASTQHGLNVSAAPDKNWSLDARNLDGRHRFTRTGRGSSVVSVERETGMLLVRLRCEGTVLNRIVGVR